MTKNKKFNIQLSTSDLSTSLALTLKKQTSTNYTKTECKKLVVWGTNLGLTINFGFYSKQIREMIDLPQFQFSTIIGLYLSDGSSTLSFVRHLSTGINSINLNNTKVSKRNASFKFKQSLEKFDYFMMVYFILSHYCSKLPYLVVNNRKGMLYYGLEFYTRSLPCFTVIHKLFYVNSDSNYSSSSYARIGKKIIPQNIFHLLDPIALAHWIQGDGCL